jgi:hypothetical protein
MLKRSARMVVLIGSSGLIGTKVVAKLRLSESLPENSSQLDIDVPRKAARRRLEYARRQFKEGTTNA